jgi:hypothetical protein
VSGTACMGLLDVDARLQYIQVPLQPFLQVDCSGMHAGFVQGILPWWLAVYVPSAVCSSHHLSLQTFRPCKPRTSASLIILKLYVSLSNAHTHRVLVCQVSWGCLPDTICWSTCTTLLLPILNLFYCNACRQGLIQAQWMVGWVDGLGRDGGMNG